MKKYLANLGLLTAMLFMLSCVDYAHKKIVRQQAAEFVRSQPDEWAEIDALLKDPARVLDLTARQKAILEDIETSALIATRIKSLVKAIIILIFSWFAVALNRKVA